jgi:hypothetical protein
MRVCIHDLAQQNEKHNNLQTDIKSCCPNATSKAFIRARSALPGLCGQHSNLLEGIVVELA